MITYEEAKAIALKANRKVDSCIEYRAAYRFCIKDSDAVGDCGVVVMKEDGSTKGFVQFIYDDEPEYRGTEIPF